MSKTKILLIAILFTGLMSLGFLLTALAQEDIPPAALPIEEAGPPPEEAVPQPAPAEIIPEPVAEMVRADEEVTAEELGVKEPTILPDNPLYVVKDVWRGIKKTITFDPVKKADLELQYANEKVTEIKKMIAKNEEKIEEAAKTSKEFKEIKEMAEEKLEESQKILEEAGTVEEKTEELQRIIDEADKVIEENTKAKEEAEIKIDDSEKIIGKVTAKVETALDKYAKDIEKIETRTEKLEEKLKDNPEFEEFLDKFADAQFKQQKLLHKIENDIPENKLFEKIEEVQGQVLEDFGEVVSRFQTPEEIQETITRIAGKQKGSDFKEFKNLEILKALEDKVPEPAKEAIRLAQDNTLQRMEERMAVMPEEQRQMFKDYVQYIPGHEARQMAVLHDFESREIPEIIREEMGLAKERAIERIEQRMMGFASADEKQMFFKPFEQGKMEDLRMIKELENNLAPETVEQIMAIKNKAMMKFKDEFTMTDQPEKREEFFKEIERFHDVRQLEVLKEIENIIPEDKKGVFEQLKTKAMDEMEKEVAMARDMQEKKMVFDKLAGDMPEHIAIIKEFGPPPEIMAEIMKEQVERLSQKIETTEDATKLAFLKARIEEEETIKKELETRNPEIFRKIDEREDMFLMGMDERRASQRIGEAQAELEKAVAEIEANQAIHDLLRQAPTFVLIDNAEKHLAKAKEAFSAANYGEAFGLATATLHEANSVRRIIKEMQLRGEKPPEGWPEKPPEPGPPGRECICPMYYAPVCGQDGRTYGNYCALKCVGVAMKHEGPCDKPKYKLFEKMEEMMPEDRFEQRMFEMLPPDQLPAEAYKEYGEKMKEIMPEEQRQRFEEMKEKGFEMPSPPREIMPMPRIVPEEMMEMMKPGYQPPPEEMMRPGPEEIREPEYPMIPEEMKERVQEMMPPEGEYRPPEGEYRPPEQYQPPTGEQITPPAQPTPPPEGGIFGIFKRLFKSIVE